MSPNRSPVAVGFDGSPMAERALRFAADLADTERRPLRVVIAVGDPHTASGRRDDWAMGLAKKWAEMWAEQARKILADEEAAGAEVVIRDGRANAVLISESAIADCLVLGAVGHGMLAGRLQGSVSQHVSRHAACTVIVVRPAQVPDSRRVVVGVDGSDASSRALEFALHYAGLHEYQLEVIYCPDLEWRPYTFGPRGALVPELIAELQAYDDWVLRGAARIIARHPGVALNVQRGSDPPATTLARASHEATLVVVGSRGRGGFHGLLLGSVSDEVLRRAACPVAVVR